MSKSKRYRPVLSACMIDHIITLAKTESPISSDSITLLGILAPFQAKIQNDAISEAYIVTPKKTIEEKLGMNIITPTDNTYILSDTKYYSKEEYWEACYILYKATPLSVECTYGVIQAAREHMYLNDLMSPEEARDFEKGIENVEPDPNYTDYK